MTDPAETFVVAPPWTGGPRRGAALEALAAAGNAIEPRFLDAAEGPVRGWLQSDCA